MSEESTLSLSSKLSPEIKNKLQQLAGKPDTTKSELPKIDNTNVKVDNNKTNRLNKSKLSQMYKSRLNLTDTIIYPI
jgi:hypothetical protein